MRKFGILLGVLLLALTFARSAAAMMPPLPLDEAVRQADIIVVGKLGPAEKAPDAGQWLVAVLKVEKVVKGAAELKEIRVAMYPNPPPPGGMHLPEGTAGVFLLRLLPKEYVKDAQTPIYQPGRLPVVLEADQLRAVEAALSKGKGE